MRLQTITYRGRPVACATATRFFLADDLERLPAGDPLLTFVIYMCAYAREVLTGRLPGPYTDHNARRFARAALVPDELADPDRIAHTQRNLQRTARALKLPAAELGEIVDAPAVQPQQASTGPYATRSMKILNWITERELDGLKRRGWIERQREPRPDERRILLTLWHPRQTIGEDNDRHQTTRRRPHA